jgi:hypothetical protein
MTPEQFCYWLQGLSEIGGRQPTPEQWQSIRDRLATVFHKVTPTYPLPSGPFFVPAVAPSFWPQRLGEITC